MQMKVPATVIDGHLDQIRFAFAFYISRNSAFILKMCLKILIKLFFWLFILNNI